MSTATDAIALLGRVRARIGAPERWTQEASARDANRVAVPLSSSNAVCWCLSGAVFLERDIFDVTLRAEGALHHCALPLSFVLFNDTHTHAEVLALIDAAIARLEGQG